MVKLSAAQQKLFIQFLKFGIVGVIGFIVDAGILIFCMQILGVGPYVGRLISFVIAASATWICNRLFTFRGQGSGHVGVQWAKFLIVSAGGFTLNYGTYAVLIATIQVVHEDPVLGVAAGSIAGMFFNFFAARTVVFK
jgi:putative flippase GtrA